MCSRTACDTRSRTPASSSNAVAILTGSVVSVVLIATKLRTRKDLVPFGPFLSLGAFLALLFGRAAIDAYLSAVGLA